GSAMARDNQNRPPDASGSVSRPYAQEQPPDAVGSAMAPVNQKRPPDAREPSAMVITPSAPRSEPKPEVASADLTRTKHSADLLKHCGPGRHKPRQPRMVEDTQDRPPNANSAEMAPIAQDKPPDTSDADMVQVAQDRPPDPIWLRPEMAQHPRQPACRGGEGGVGASVAGTVASIVAGIVVAIVATANSTLALAYNQVA